ncbi:MAG: PaaI family thioesterase [Myxococcaceae bacterium]
MSAAAIALIEEARRTGNWTPLVEAIPYARFLGISFEETGGALIGRLRFGDHLVGNPTLPALHGGALGGFLESAAHFELMVRAGSVVLPKTITLTIDYLRSGKPADTLVRTTLVKQGRRVATVHAHAWQEDEAKPIAFATVHLLIPGT